MHVYVQQKPWNTRPFLQACSWDAYRWTVRRVWVSPTSFGFNHVTFSHNCRMPPSWPCTWYGQFCSIYHLLSTDGGIPIARHIVWTISTGRAVDCGGIIVWNTHIICRRECGRHGYHPLIPSLRIEWVKQQSTYEGNCTCNLQSTLMRSGFVSTLLGMVVNMWWTSRAESAFAAWTEDSDTLEYLHSGFIMVSKWIEDQVE